MMAWVWRTALAVSFAVPLALSAPSETRAEMVHWKDVEGWRIAVNPNFIPSSCTISATFEDGEKFLVGMDPGRESFYFTIGHAEWRSIKNDGEYVLKVFFGDETPWTLHTLGGVDETGRRYLFGAVDMPLFLEEFAGENNVVFYYEGTRIAGLNLSGSYQALLEALACQEAMNADTRTARADDPFVRTPASDPFAR